MPGIEEEDREKIAAPVGDSAVGSVDSRYDTFISYSKLDAGVAERVCRELESRGIRCWIAPRDIEPGSNNFGEAILEGISRSRSMVLIFSSHADQSPHCLREVERAVNKRIDIFTIRIEAIQPSQLAYFINIAQWMDVTKGFEKSHFDRLKDLIYRRRTPPGPATNPIRTIPDSNSPPADSIDPRRAAHFSTWLYFAVAIAVAMVATKAVERVLEGMTFYDALAYAMLTRTRNFGAFLLVSAVLTVLSYVLALGRQPRSASPGPGRHSFWLPAAGAVAYEWGIYLHGVSSSPDPGTFFSTSAGLGYVCQFVEGCTNLAGLGVLAVWTVVAWKLANTIGRSGRSIRRSDRSSVALLGIGAIMPALIFGTYCLVATLDWMREYWGHGNLWPGVAGYAALIFLPNILLLFHLLGRVAPALAGTSVSERSREDLDPSAR